MQPNFNGPIPGESLTHELGSQPDERPAEITDPTDAYNFFAKNLVEEESLKRLALAAELGMPVEMLTRSLLFAAWAEGKITFDAMYLIFSPLFSYMMEVLDKVGVTYVDLVPRNETDELEEVMEMLHKRKDFFNEGKAEAPVEVEEEEADEAEEEEDKVPVGGLMGRPE